MPDAPASVCKLCMGSRLCWFCQSEDLGHPCGECAPGAPGRCIRCDGSGVQPDPPEAA